MKSVITPDYQERNIHTMYLSILANQQREMPFRLLRSFTLISLISIIISSIVLWYWFERISVNNLIDIEERNNVTLARLLSQSTWPKYKDFLSSASQFSVANLKRHPTIKNLDTTLVNQTKGIGVIKIKIYDLQGYTAYSTDFNQIGTSKSGIEAFESAKKGKTVSKLVFRDKFYARKELLTNRNVLSSYIPITRGTNIKIEGVFEIYKDVSALIKDIYSTQIIIIVGIFSVLGLLFIVLFFVVRRADKIIQSYYQEQQSNTERIEHQAYHDGLTGLPNRVLFLDRLEHAMAHAQAEHHLVALMFIDLDRFKQINDSLGHENGDKLLIEVAHRIRDCSRPADTVARLAGDEFMVVIEGLKTVDLAITFAQRIINSLEKPISLDRHEIVCTCSIGIALYPFEDDTPQVLIQKADTAMYYAKQRGRNTFHFFSPDINQLPNVQLRLEKDLHYALEKGQFELYFQPKVNLNNWNIQGMEALLRWHHPERGLIPPAEFIPILEETGMIANVGQWVLNEACRLNKQWQDSGLPPLRVAVNVSSKQLNSEDFIDIVFAALDKTGLAPEYLELELTESGLLTDIDANIALFNQLREKGITLALDDFGTGYSSLSYLCKLPIDVIKIDKEFVHQITNNKENRSVVTAILSFAHGLRMDVVAEGVETAEQLVFLSAMRCTSAQGFLLSHPLPAEKFEELYRSGRNFENLIEKIRKQWQKR